jgi:hypothetical protein
MRYAKFVTAVITAALVAAQNAVPMSDTAHGWVTVALAALGAVAVYAVPNVAPPVPAPTKDAA